MSHGPRGVKRRGRSHLNEESRLRGIAGAIKSPRTPPALREGLRRKYEKVLIKKGLV